MCGCGGGAKGAKVNDGSVLDRVISQASGEDDCLLYRLANYKNGGELIDAYNTGGQVEVERLIRDQFGVLMYADGRGQVINRAEYLLWKFRDHKQVVLPIEASLSPHDPLAKWEDHEACWQMQYRGSLGERGTPPSVPVHCGSGRPRPIQVLGARGAKVNISPDSKSYSRNRWLRNGSNLKESAKKAKKITKWRDEINKIIYLGYEGK